MFGLERNRERSEGQLQGDQERIEERRGFLKKAGVAAGAVAAVATVPTMAFGSGAGAGLTTVPGEAPKPEGKTPLATRMRGIDFSTPRSPDPEKARKMLGLGREPRVTASLIADFGDGKLTPIQRKITLKRSGPTSFSWAVDPWDCDRDCTMIGVFVKYHDISEHAVAHFVAPPSLKAGNILNVNYTLS